MTQKYFLKLYIVHNQTIISQTVIKTLDKIFFEKIKNKYTLEIIDIFKKPLKAEDEKILVTPTLIKELPIPLKRIVGDFSNEEQVLRALTF